MEILTNSLSILKNVLYFIAGAFMFLIILSNFSNVKVATEGQFGIWAVCCFIVWCWIFSKLIVL